jgi:hypothetical protein
VKNMQITPPPTVHIDAPGDIRVVFPQPPTVHIFASAGNVLDEGPSSSGMTFSRVVHVSGPSRSTTQGKAKAEKTKRR